MEDETSNLEWKKQGFGESEKVTRKTNVKKALQFEATQKSPLGNAFTPLPSDLPKGLKNLRKKLIKKDAYDEEEEEENSFSFMPMEQNNSSLLNALHDDEKNQLKQQATLKNMELQQTAGKMEALMMANKATQSLGMKKLKPETINKSMVDPTLNADTFQKAVRDDLSKKLRLGGKRLSERETVMMLRGVDRIRNMAAASDKSQAKALQGLKIEKIIEYGDPTKKTDQQLAEEILVKSGRKEDKKKAAKKIIDKSRSKEIVGKKGQVRE